MKTITEFNGIHIKNTAKLKADLTAAGKTPEEIGPAIGEALKLEGEKLTHLLNAVETVGGKQEDLKRVVVYSVQENEKAPHGSQKHGENVYAPEYYPSLNARKQQAGKPGEDRGGRRGDRDKKGKKGRGGRRGGGDRDRAAGGGAPGEKREAGAGEGGRGRNRRPPRGPAPGAAPQGPSRGIIPVAKPGATQADSSQIKSETPAAPEAPKEASQS